MVALPFVVAAVTLSAAVVGAVLIGDTSGTDPVNSFVIALSDIYRENSERIIQGRFHFAFEMGVAVSFHHCGLFLLFAYAALYLGTGEYEFEAPLVARLRRALGRALVVGGAIIAGLAGTFGVAAVIIETGGRSLVREALPWMALAISVVLTLAAGWLLARSQVYSALARTSASRNGSPGRNSAVGYFLLSLAFAAVFLSCSLPIFLVAIGSPFSLGQLVQFTMGMAASLFLPTMVIALVIIALILAMALLKAIMADVVRDALPLVNTARAFLITTSEAVGILWVILAAGYIVFFWFTVGLEYLLAEKA